MNPNQLESAIVFRRTTYIGMIGILVFTFMFVNNFYSKSSHQTALLIFVALIGASVALVIQGATGILGAHKIIFASGLIALCEVYPVRVGGLSSTLVYFGTLATIWLIYRGVVWMRRWLKETAGWD